jgi:hypothetical protein
MLDAAYEVRRSYLGDDHRDTLATLERLAALADAQGEHEQAQQQFEHVLGGLRRLDGPSSVPVAIVERNLACSLRSSCDVEGAARLFARVDKVFRARLPDDDVEYLALRKARAYLALAIDEPVDTARYAADAVEKTRLPELHPLVGSGYLLLAQAAVKLGSLDQTETFLTKATASFERLGSHPLAAIVIGTRADLLHERGQREAALAAARQWRDKLATFYPRTAHGFASQICERFIRLGAIDDARSEAEAMFAVERPGMLAAICALHVAGTYHGGRDPDIVRWLERGIPAAGKYQQVLKYQLDHWRRHFKKAKLEP